MRLHGRMLRLLAIIPLYMLTMVMVHELGHAMTAAHLIRGDVRLYVWPGYELFPDLGRQYPEAWPDDIPAMTYVLPESLPGQWKITPGTPPLSVWEVPGAETFLRNQHLVKAMGSGSTLLLSLAALGLLTWRKPRGFGLWLLAAGALLHLDLLTGTVFPVFFDARHLYFWGSATPEAVDALASLGVPESISVTAVILLSLALCGWLGALLRVRPRRPGQDA